MKRKVLESLLAAGGVLLMAAGLLLLRAFPEAVSGGPGWRLTCWWGSGADVRPWDGGIISRRALKGAPDVQKALEIERTDERNVMIGNAAKGKAFDLMTYLYGALTFFFRDYGYRDCAGTFAGGGVPLCPWVRGLLADSAGKGNVKILRRYLIVTLTIETFQTSSQRSEDRSLDERSHVFGAGDTAASNSGSQGPARVLVRPGEAWSHPRGTLGRCLKGSEMKHSMLQILKLFTQIFPS